MLLKGVAWTLGLTAISAVIGVGLGVACAWARVHGAHLAANGWSARMWS
jgi:polar amino acid transport system permease protein